MLMKSKLLFFNSMDMIVSKEEKVHTSDVFNPYNIILVDINKIPPKHLEEYTATLLVLNRKNINHLEHVISPELITLY